MNNKNSLLPFKPHPLVAGGHLQTIVGYYFPGPKKLRSTQIHQVEVSDGDRLAICENRPGRKTSFKKVIVFMHGLGGDASSPYMPRLAELFKNRGWVVFRMNHRGCGEGSGLARNLYHSGRSDDVSQVLLKVAELHPDTPLIAVGFSLSGNALLKLLGEKREPTPAGLRGAIAVTPPIELSLCAAALSRKSNKLYDLRFIRTLRQAVEERRQAFPDFPEIDFRWNMTLREFDEVCTAPMNHFEDAEDYYTKCSAKQFLQGISIPTFLLASKDDPFIPKETFDDLPGNDLVDFHLARSGGHMGFVSAGKTPLGNHRWMDYAILKYSEKFLASY